VYVTGHAENGPGQGTDLVTLKYAPDGTELWQASYAGAPGGDEHAFRVAVDGFGCTYVAGTVGPRVSPEIVLFKYDNRLPSAPEELTVRPVAAGSAGAGLTVTYNAALTWRGTSPITQEYRLERKPGRAADPGDFVEVQSFPAETTSFRDTTIRPGLTYTYRVQALNGNGVSSYSNLATLVPPKPPAAPANVTIRAVFGRQIQLFWLPPAPGGIPDGITVERKPGGPREPGSFAAVGRLPGTARAFQDAHLAPARTYTYRLRASNLGGVSPYSVPVSATVYAVPPAPGQLTATLLPGRRVRLAWTGTDTLPCCVERKSGTSAFREVRRVGAGETGCVDTGLQSGTRYTYRVRALGEGDYSAYSSEASVQTLAPPASPANLTATVLSPTQVKLTWQDRSADEEGFRLETGTGPLQSVRYIPANTTSLLLSGLTPGASYTCRIQAYNENGLSGYAAAPPVSLPR
jgi:hypothetical protein